MTQTVQEFEQALSYALGQFQQPRSIQTKPERPTPRKEGYSFKLEVYSNNPHDHFSVVLESKSIFKTAAEIDVRKQAKSSGLTVWSVLEAKQLK